MLEFIQSKAEELGAHDCPQCGHLDIGFGLSGNKPGGGSCIDCMGDVQKYSALKTMQYSLEVFRELIANYDDHPVGDNKYLVESLGNFLAPIQTRNTMPSDGDILRLQAAIKTMNIVFGSEKQLGGGVALQFGKLTIALSEDHYNDQTLEVLAVCMLAINYILTYPAKPTAVKSVPAKPEKKGLFSRWFS